MFLCKKLLIALRWQDCLSYVIPIQLFITFPSNATTNQNGNPIKQPQSLDAYKQNAFQIPQPYMKLNPGKKALSKNKKKPQKFMPKFMPKQQPE